MSRFSPTDPIAPTDQDMQLARESSKALASFVSSKNSHLQLHVRTRNKRQAEIALPTSVVRLILEALQEIANGSVVTMVSVNTELTTQQAADILKVSRPFFVKLLEDGKLPFRLVGAHRRILYHELLKYMQA